MPPSPRLTHLNRAGSRIARITSNPLIPGIRMSRVTASKRSLRAAFADQKKSMPFARYAATAGSIGLSKEMGAWTRVLVDVEDYRGRRERQLRELAERAAARVVETGKMLQLEPMPALERRWIHLTLRNHAGVATQSIGEEPNRRVVLVPRAG